MSETCAMIEARIEERGNGYPDVGDYVPGVDGELYRIVEIDSSTQPGASGCHGWVTARVDHVDWGDEDDVHTARVVLG